MRAVNALLDALQATSRSRDGSATAAWDGVAGSGVTDGVAGSGVTDDVGEGVAVAVTVTVAEGYASPFEPVPQPTNMAAKTANNPKRLTITVTPRVQRI